MPGEQLVHSVMPRWLRRVTPLAPVVAVIPPLVAWAITGRIRPVDLLLSVPFLLAVAHQRLFLRASLVVDREGLDLPRRGRRVRWEEVDHVCRPGPWDSTVALVLTDARDVRTPYPVALAGEIAAVGGKPLR